MMHLTYSPDDYDGKGQLRLPLGFWAVLLLQARTWVLFVAAGASRQQSASLLELFYPDARAFWIGLALGVPAALGMLLTGYRQRLPRLWQIWRNVLSLALVAMLIQQGVTVWNGEEEISAPAILFAGFDIVGLFYLWLNVRLRDCFDPKLNGG